jgi:D-3-phosphoglycerate dehydrogenase
MTEKSFKILNAEPSNYSEEATKLLGELGIVDNFHLTRNSLLNCIHEYDILIVRLGFQIDEEILQAAKKLKIIVTATTGLDHIDFKATEKYGISVLSLKGEIDFLRSIPATAELTWGLLLALTRKIPSAYHSVIKNEWNREKFRGIDLYNKKLGILGLGRIGEKIARYGNVFGMQVAFFDIDKVKKIPDIKQMDNISDLFSWAEIISVHIPLNENNVNLIGKEYLSLINNGYLINTSRGEIIDELALIHSLKNGNLLGAAVDVIQNERRFDLENSPLINFAKENENLIITPHIGGATSDSMESTEIFMAKKLSSFIKEIYG